MLKYLRNRGCTVFPIIKHFLKFPGQRTTAGNDRFWMSSCMSTTFETRRIASQRKENNLQFFVILNILGRPLNDRSHLGGPV
jgi:hypothetical protein